MMTTTKDENGRLAELLERVPSQFMERELARRRKLPAALAPEQRLVAQAAAAWGLEPEDMQRRCRDKRVTDARQAAMVLLRTRALLSFPRIADIFGMDHGTVIHALRTHARRMADPEFAWRFERAAGQKGGQA